MIHGCNNELKYRLVIGHYHILSIIVTLSYRLQVGDVFVHLCIPLSWLPHVSSVLDVPAHPHVEKRRWSLRLSLYLAGTGVCKGSNTCTSSLSDEWPVPNLFISISCA